MLTILVQVRFSLIIYALRVLNYLIAGYVKKVATLFDSAPSIKAEKAESASADESEDFCLCLSSRYLS